MNSDIEYLKSCVKSIPDFPKPGIIFRDISSVCENPKAFSLLCHYLALPFKDKGITKVAGTESRGFVFGAPVAQILGAGFVMVRKKGKLPRAVYREDYALEYGTNTLEIHKDCLNPEDRVLLVDDLIATGGTIEAAYRLVQKCGAKVVGASFAICLPDLGGLEKLKKLDINCESVLDFPGH